MPTSSGRISFRPVRGASLVYSVAFMLFRLYYVFAAKLTAEGVENVPASGGLVVCCNHTRGNDYFAWGLAFPRWLRFMGKAEAFEWSPVLRWILVNGGMFPVNRGAGDLAALQTAVDLVKGGAALGMFPEGHRSEDGKLQRGHTGAARIALEANAQVIPVVVIGAEAGWENFPRFWKRPTILIRIGKPFYLEGASGTDRRAISRGHRQLMTAMAELLPEEMRGYWGEPAAVKMSPGVAAAVTSPGREADLDTPAGPSLAPAQPSDES